MELETTSVYRSYWDKGELNVELISRGFAWLNSGMHDSLMEAGNFVKTIEKRFGLKVFCPEGIVFEMVGLFEISWLRGAQNCQRTNMVNIY